MGDKLLLIGGSREGAGDGTGEDPGDGVADGTGDGAGDGIVDGTGEGSGEGTGDGTGEGTGDGTGDGTGEGSGDGTIGLAVCKTVMFTIPTDAAWPSALLTLKYIVTSVVLAVTAENKAVA